MTSAPSKITKVRLRPVHYVDRLRVRHLRLLDLVARHGSLTAAAQTLRVSQPNATKLLQELEHAFGCTLVARSVRGGVLSEAGHRVLERLKVAMGALDAVRDALASQPARPLVRVGALPLAGVYLIPRAVQALALRGELPRLEIQEGGVPEVVARLSAGEVDCVIGRVGDIQGLGEGRFDIVPLFDEGFEVACASGHPLGRRRRVSLAELQGSRWIVAPRGTYTRQVFDAAFLRQGLEPPAPEIQSPSFHTSLATAACTDLIAFVPRSAARLYRSHGSVRQVSLAEPFQTDHAAFLTLRGVPPLPSVMALQAALQEVASLPER